jgi:cytochrome o ubiquinol oxidase subunit 3
MSGAVTSHPGINLSYDDPDRHEQDAKTLFGFWVFLMSDAVLFCLLFATYATMVHRTAQGPGGPDLFKLTHTLEETCLLLTSSLTFGLATNALKRNAIPGLCGWMAATLLLGIGFLVLEGQELGGMLAKAEGPTHSGFLSAFFVLVGTHGLHVTFGCIWMLVMFVQLAVFGLHDDTKTRLLRLGLYWHFLDLIWIGIFSIVYLSGLA